MILCIAEAKSLFSFADIKIVCLVGASRQGHLYNISDVGLWCDDDDKVTNRAVGTTLLYIIVYLFLCYVQWCCNLFSPGEFWIKWRPLKTWRTPDIQPYGHNIQIIWPTNWKNRELVSFSFPLVESEPGNNEDCGGGQGGCYSSPLKNNNLKQNILAKRFNSPWTWLLTHQRPDASRDCQN